MTQPPPRTPELWLEEVARRSNLPPVVAAAVLEPERRRVEDMRAAGLSDAKIVMELGPQRTAISRLKGGWNEMRKLRQRLKWPFIDAIYPTFVVLFVMGNTTVNMFELSEQQLLWILGLVAALAVYGIGQLAQAIRAQPRIWQKLGLFRQGSFTLALTVLVSVQSLSFVLPQQPLWGTVVAGLALLYVGWRNRSFTTPYLTEWQQQGINLDYLLFVNLEEGTP